MNEYVYLFLIIICILVEFRKSIYRIYLAINNLSSFIFLPGVITHEFGHFISCILLRIKVKEYRFFVFPNGIFDDYSLAGSVNIESTNFKKRVIVVFMPLLFNWSIGLSLLVFFNTKNIFLDVFSFWLSFVFFSEGFPSLADLNNINIEVNNKKIDVFYNMFKGGLSFLLTILLI